MLFGLGLPVVLAAEASDGGQGVIAFAQLIVLSLLIGGAAALVMRRFMDTVHTVRASGCCSCSWSCWPRWP